MAAMSGADPDQLDRAAGEFDSSAQLLVELRRSLDRHIRSAPWRGANADRFLQQWDGQHHRALREARAYLEAAGAELRRNAEEQRWASGADAAGAGRDIRWEACVAPRDPLQTRIRDTRAAMEEELEDLLRQREAAGDGLFAWLDDKIPGGRMTREEMDKRIERLQKLLKDPSRQFLRVDVCGEGRIIEVLGDLSGADHIAIHIPGMSTEMRSYLETSHPDARALRQEMDKVAGPGSRNVVIAFLDYDPPDAGDLVGVARSDSARDGAKNLSALVDDLRRNGFSRDQITPIAHSYGSTLTGWALSHEDLDVARVGVVGSPGLRRGVDEISDLGRSDVEVYAGRAQGIEIFGSGDAVGLAPAHGEDPTDEGFGATRFSVGKARGHSEYFSDSGSIKNLARIATGRLPE